MSEAIISLRKGSLVQGRYTVEQLLGKGGFGAVYLVRDQRVSGNVYALKEVIDPNAKERARFTFEGEVLKRLDHPALPRVYRSFDDPQHARVYILMDYIEGSNLEVLRQRQPEKRFSLRSALQIMTPVFAAVSFLHYQRPPIVHRDIKPSNIIVPSSGSDAVLVDFGIAKEYDSDATTTAVRHCSPGYGAPEQYARGTNPRTDIYGLAATLYTLLTGVIPSDALHRMTQLSSKHLDPLERVSTLVPDIPEKVSDAIQRAMAIQSKDRFASVEEFWRALQSPDSLPPAGVSHASFASAAPASEPPVTPDTRETAPTPLYPSPSPVARKRRRHPLLMWFLLLALVALVAGVVFGTVVFPMISHARMPQKTTGSPQGMVPSAHVTATARANAHPTATATATAPTPTATATTAPAPTPTPTQQVQATPSSVAATATVNVPSLNTAYAGTISDQGTNPPTDTTLDLSAIQQNGPAINGTLVVGPGLVASNTFSGSVTAEKAIQFTVPSYNGLAPLLFTGQIQSDGTLSGTYCSYRNANQCDQNAGGWGNWDVKPQSSGS